MIRLRKIFRTGGLAGLFALLTAGLLSACGGAVDNTTPKDLTYSGLTSQAVLTSNNDDAFGTAMLEGGAANGEMKSQVPYLSVTTNATSESSKTQIAAMESLAQIIKDHIKQQRTNQGVSAQASAIGAVVLEGGCGGNIDVSGSESGGAITYNNFCIGDTTFSMTMNGTVTYSFIGDFYGDYTLTVNYSLLTVTIKDDTETFTHTFSGTLTISETGGVTTVTFTSYFQREGKVFMVKDLDVNVSGGTATISGRLYHPDYGYVDITTPTPFNVNSKKQYCGGTLRIEAVGENGATAYSTITVSGDCSTYDISFNGNPADTVPWY